MSQASTAIPGSNISISEEISPQDDARADLSRQLLAAMLHAPKKSPIECLPALMRTILVFHHNSSSTQEDLLAFASIKLHEIGILEKPASMLSSTEANVAV